MKGSRAVVLADAGSALDMRRQTNRTSANPAAAMWSRVIASDRPWSYLKRRRCPLSLARLMAGISICLDGTAVIATAASSAAASVSCDHSSAAAGTAVTITNR